MKYCSQYSLAVGMSKLLDDVLTATIDISDGHKIAQMFKIQETILSSNPFDLTKQLSKKAIEVLLQEIQAGKDKDAGSRNKK